MRKTERTKPAQVKGRPAKENEILKTVSTSCHSATMRFMPCSNYTTGFLSVKTRVPWCNRTSNSVGEKHVSSSTFREIYLWSLLTHKDSNNDCASDVRFAVRHVSNTCARDPLIVSSSLEYRGSVIRNFVTNSLKYLLRNLNLFRVYRGWTVKFHKLFQLSCEPVKLTKCDFLSLIIITPFLMDFFFLRYRYF